MTAHIKQTLTLITALLGAVLIFTTQASGEPSKQTTDKGPGGPQVATGELLVTYKQNSPKNERAATVRQVGAKTEKSLPRIEAQLLSFPEIKNDRSRENREQALEKRKNALEKKSSVKAVDYNYLRKPSLTPNDPYFRGAPQYGLMKPNFPKAWDRVRGKTIRIAIVDTGIATAHPDFNGRIAVQKDFVNNDSIAEDDTGHGSHVAGTAGANTGNKTGVASGAFASSLIVAKALDAGGGFDSDIADAIIWSTYNGSHVINLSLGGPGDSQTLQNAINFARGKDNVVVAAAGNDSSNVKSYPAAYDNVIAVAATNRNDRPASFSNYGDWIELSAPGVNIVSTVPGGYAYYSGTSMASPHVAALAALLRNQGLNSSEIRYWLRRTAVDFGPRGKDVYHGYGRIDAEKAIFAKK